MLYHQILVRCLLNKICFRRKYYVTFCHTLHENLKTSSLYHSYHIWDIIKQPLEVTPPPLNKSLSSLGSLHQSCWHVVWWWKNSVEARLGGMIEQSLLKQISSLRPNQAAASWYCQIYGKEMPKCFTLCSFTSPIKPLVFSIHLTWGSNSVLFLHSCLVFC